MWLCDTETEVLLWLTGMWNYLQVYFTSCLSIGDKFYCLDMLILVYKNLSDEVNKSCALEIMAKKKVNHKVSHKGVNLISLAICYGDSTSSQNPAYLDFQFGCF